MHRQRRSRFNAGICGRIREELRQVQIAISFIVTTWPFPLQEMPPSGLFGKRLPHRCEFYVPLAPLRTLGSQSQPPTLIRLTAE
jgi:hypothetical protein